MVREKVIFALTSGNGKTFTSLRIRTFKKSRLALGKCSDLNNDTSTFAMLIHNFFSKVYKLNFVLLIL